MAQAGIATLIAFALAGCSHSVSATSTPQADAPFVAASPLAGTTAPTPTAADAGPTSWIIDFTAVGPIALGAPLADVAAHLPGFTNMVEPSSGDGDQLWVAAGTPEIAVLRPDVDNPPPIVGSIVVIGYGGYSRPEESTANSPRTDRGIGTGSTVDALLAAYPGIEKTGTYGESVDFYGIPGDSGRWVVFEVRTDLGIIIAIQLGTTRLFPRD